MSTLTAWWWRLVRFGFRLLYNELAFTYDAVSWVVSLGAWRCWQRSALGYLPPPGAGKLLEIAHGTGNLQLDLHAAGYDTVGYDLSSAMGHIARAKLHRNDITPAFARGMAQSLPFADATFAGVVSTFPTDFIMKVDTLCEVHRVLRSDGVFVIVLNGQLTGSGAIKMLLEWLYRITGQRENAHIDLVTYFEGQGFDVSAQESDCKNSVAQLVVLRKRR